MNCICNCVLWTRIGVILRIDAVYYALNNLIFNGRIQKENLIECIELQRKTGLMDNTLLFINNYCTFYKVFELLCISRKINSIF